jgi:hypothetical protein
LQLAKPGVSVALGQAGVLGQLVDRVSQLGARRGDAAAHPVADEIDSRVLALEHDRGLVRLKRRKYVLAARLVRIVDAEDGASARQQPDPFRVIDWRSDQLDAVLERALTRELAQRGEIVAAPG